MLPPHVHQKLKKVQAQKKKIVLVTGVFDLLHQEHRTFLEKAKGVGDVLVVAIESDVRVRQIKGEGRPVQTQTIRQAEIEKLPFVDVVFILPEEFFKTEHYNQLMIDVEPAILAVSSSSPYLENKQKIVEEFGGKLMIVHQHNPSVSTTQLLAQNAKNGNDRGKGGV